MVRAAGIGWQRAGMCRGAGPVVCGHLLIGPETDQFFSTEHLRWDVAA